MIWISGGAKSGKSKFAEQYASRLGKSGIYVATTLMNVEKDEEMRLKIAKHQEQRTATGFPWKTAEVPYDLSAWLKDYRSKAVSTDMARTSSNSANYSSSSDVKTEAKQETVILVDCLTMWLSNWLLKLDYEGKDSEAQLAGKIDELSDVVKDYPIPLLLVSNEVGDGVVPEYPLGRQFRDAAGRMNQQIAAISDQAILVTAGIPVDLKKLAFQWEE